MKQVSGVVLLLLITRISFSQIGLGITTPHSKAHFEVASTSKGVLLPRMTALQRLAISPDATARGLIVYDTDSSAYMFWNGSVWGKIGSDNNGKYWSANGNHIYNNNAGRVGIGTSNPLARLQVVDSAVLFSSQAPLNNINPDAPPISGAGTRMLWYPQKAAFRVGMIDNGLLAYGYPDGSIPLTAWDRDSIGQFSFAAGYNTKAKGGASVALGGYTEATGLNSFAAGAMTIAAGNGSFAMGISNQTTGNFSMVFGSHNRISGEHGGAMGFSNVVTGQYSFAGGSMNTQSGTNSFTYGNGNNVSGDNAVAFGGANYATGPYTFVSGLGSQATAIGAVSVGYNSKSTGPYSFSAGYQSNAFASSTVALGINSTAQGDESVAIGSGNLVSGLRSGGIGYLNTIETQGSFALGSQNYITAMGGMALGTQNNVTGVFATGLGNMNTASGMYATTIGFQNTASSSFTFTGGSGSYAQGMSSFAFGEGVYAPHDHSFSIGKYNDRSETFQPPSNADQEKLFQIGNGTSDFSRSNALTVLKSSYTGIGIARPQAHLHILAQNGDDSRLFFQNMNQYNPISGIYLRNPDEFRFFTPSDHNFNFGVGNYGTHTTRLYIKGSTGRVGVSTIDPEAALDMRGMQTETQSVLFGKDDANNSFGIGYATVGGGRTQVYHTPLAANISFGYGTASNFNPVMYIQNGSQKVGIGTEYPSEKLHVVGNLRLQTGAEGLGKVLTSDAFGVATWQDGPGSYWAKNGNHIYNTNSGRVGVGTSTPNAGFHVKDSMVFFSSSQDIWNNPSPPEPPSESMGASLLWYPQKGAFRAGHSGFWNVWARDSIGIGSVAMGSATKAKGDVSVALGGLTEAWGSGAFAVGSSSKAIGSNSVSMGIYSISRGDVSFGAGESVEANGSYAVALGRQSKAGGWYSIAAGYNTETTSLFGIALGEGSISWGDYGFAGGRNGRALGMMGFAYGDYAIASGSNSLSIGDTTVAFGNNSFVLGSQSEAKASFGVAIGDHLQNRAQNGFVIGSYNDRSDNPDSNTPQSTDRIFQIGNGNSIYYSNAITVLRNGMVGFQKTNPIYTIDVLGTGFISEGFTAGSISTNGQLTAGNTYINGNALISGNEQIIGNLSVQDTTFVNHIQIQGNSFSPGMVLTTDLNGMGTWQWSPSPHWILNGNNLYNENSGNVGLGESFPTEKLTVAGNILLSGHIQMMGGTVGAGKVLTSDAFGVGTWQTPSSGLWAANGNDIYNTNTANVGIGTSTISSFGHGGTNKIQQIHNSGTGANIQSHLILSSAGTSGSLGGITWAGTNFLGEQRGAFMGSGIESGSTNPSVGMFFYTRNSGGTLVENLRISGTGNVGINQSSPAFPLNFASALGDKISLWGNTAGAAHYGFGIQSGLLQIHTDGTASNIVFGAGTSASFTERMRIINAGGDGMILNGRLHLKNGTNPLDINYGGGIWLYKADNSASLGFMGTQNNQNIGFYGGPLGWGFTYDAINSRVGVGTNTPAKPMEIVGSGATPVTLVIGNRSGFGAAQLEFVSDYGLGSQWRPGYIKSNDLGSFTGALEFYTNGTSSSNLYGNVKGFEVRNGSALTATGAVGSYSDARLKHDVHPFKDGLNIIRQIHPVQFRYNEQAPFNTNREQIGVIAQDLEQVAPYMVDQVKTKDIEDLRTVNNQAYTFLLINSVQEQQQQIEALKAQVEQLQQLVQKLLPPAQPAPKQ